MVAQVPCINRDEEVKVTIWSEPEREMADVDPGEKVCDGFRKCRGQSE